MVAESKRLNPLSIALDSILEKYILLGEYQEIPDYDLQSGCVIGSKNYGFNLITPNEKESYYTQCPIYALEVKNNLLIVHEEGKTIPWKFSLDGNCINAASFLAFSRKDVKYLTENLGLHKALLERVNEEAYSFESNISNVSENSNFYNISGDTLIINSNVEKINRKMFYKDFSNNKTINKIILEDGIKTIDAGSFSDFSNLTTLYIPKSVENIALYIADEKITNNLQVFFEEKKLPIKYGIFVDLFFKQKIPVKKAIDMLHDIFTIEDNILHIKKISKNTIDALIIFDFLNITTIVIDDDLVDNNNDKTFIKDFYNVINNIDTFNKVVFKKECSIIVTKEEVEYEYNEKTLVLNNEKTFYPNMAKLITDEIINLLGITANNYELIFELFINQLGESGKYLINENQYIKLFIMGFTDIMKVLIKYDSINDLQQESTIVTWIEKITNILLGKDSLISNKIISEKIVDLTECQNYLLFQKIFGIENASITEKCDFYNTKIIMPSLPLFSFNSFFRTTFNKVNFSNITPSSWQPKIIDGVSENTEKSLGGGITFKTNLYLELGRECNAACSFCMNKSFEHEDLNFDSLQKSIEFLAPYLDDVFIGGGEPTLKMEFLYKAKQILQSYFINPTIISNGSGLSDTYKMLWDEGMNIGISRHAVSDDENKEIFGINEILSENQLSEMIEQQKGRKLTIFVTCMPEHIYSTESILKFIDTFHKLGCNIIFQSPMLDKTLGNLNKIYELKDNPTSQIFTEAGIKLRNSKFSSSIPIIGTAGYRLVTYEKIGLGTISFKEYITNKEYENCWPGAIKRTFDLAIKPSGDIFENWNSEGKKLELNFGR